jgi:hypothetical protein
MQGKITTEPLIGLNEADSLWDNFNLLLDIPRRVFIIVFNVRLPYLHRLEWSVAGCQWTVATPLRAISSCNVRLGGDAVTGKLIWRVDSTEVDAPYLRRPSPRQLIMIDVSRAYS